MNSNIKYQIEKLRLEIQTGDINWEQVDNVFQDQSHIQIIRSIDWFVQNIKPVHNIEGKTWEQFVGIGHWIRNNQHATDKQTRWLALNMALHWDQLRDEIHLDSYW